MIGTAFEAADGGLGGATEGTVTPGLGTKLVIATAERNAGIASSAGGERKTDHVKVPRAMTPAIPAIPTGNQRRTAFDGDAVLPQAASIGMEPGFLAGSE